MVQLLAVGYCTALSHRFTTKSNLYTGLHTAFATAATTCLCDNAAGTVGFCKPQQNRTCYGLPVVLYVARVASSNTHRTRQTILDIYVSKVDSGPLGLSLEASYGVNGLILNQAWSDCDIDRGIDRHSIRVRYSQRHREGYTCCSAMDVGTSYDRSSSSGLIKVRRVDIGGSKACALTTSTLSLENLGVVAPPTPLRPCLLTRRVGRRTAGGTGGEQAQIVREGVLAVEEGDILVRVDDVQVRSAARQTSA